MVSYEAFDQKINRVANWFLELGVKKEDRVCFILSNRPEFLYAWFGLAGAVMAPINTGFKESEAGYIANHSEAVGLIVDDEFLPTARAI